MRCDKKARLVSVLSVHFIIKAAVVLHRTEETIAITDELDRDQFQNIEHLALLCGVSGCGWTSVRTATVPIGTSASRANWRTISTGKTGLTIVAMSGSAIQFVLVKRASGLI